MRQLTIEMDEEEAAQLAAAARSLRIDPAHMTKAQLLQLFGSGKNTKWRQGPGARRVRAALKRAKTAQVSLMLTLRPHAVRANPGGQSSSQNATAAPGQADPQKTALAAPARRLEALMTMQGIWKGDPDKPQDGVAYQQELRAEWR